MSQDGFEFGPPPPRREPRQFEPPPWERDQFERHARERAEREKARLEAEAARQSAEAVAQGQAAGEGTGADANAEQAENPGASPPGARASAERPRAHVNDPTAAGARAQPAGDLKLAGTPVDEKQVELMMLELKAEEPTALKGAWMVAVGAGIFMALVGIVIGILGAAAMARVGRAGWFGEMVVVTFGLAFVGIGAWLVYGALRQRGVL